jgi:hypothetical protein
MSKRLAFVAILLLFLAPALAEVDTTWLKPYRTLQGKPYFDRNLMHKFKHRLFDDAIERSKAVRVREIIEGEPSVPYCDRLARARASQANHTAGGASTHAGAGGMMAAIEDFLVNDDTAGAGDHYNPAIARRSSSGFVIVWEDQRHGGTDIYAQRYDSSAIPLGPNLKVNDNEGSVWHGGPSVAMDESGNFVIAWMDDRTNPFSDIYAQRYDSVGSTLGSNFKVNDDAGTAYHLFPAMAGDGSGNFVIAWEDDRGGDFDVYAQRYDRSGNPLGSNFKVNDGAGTGWERDISAAMDDSGRFVITWTDQREFGDDIFAQRYESSGSPLGSNFKVNDDPGGVFQWWSSVAMSGDGGCVVSWCDGRNAESDVYAQRYDGDGAPLGSNFQVNDDIGSGFQGPPAVGADDSGNFVITWEDERSGDRDIYGQRYDSAGVAVGSNFNVNDDVGPAHQSKARVATEATGKFVITWQDERGGNFSIYAQGYSSSGAPVDTNFRVDDDVGTATQYDPTIAADGRGGLVVAWRDSRGGDYDIYAQRYDSAGTPSGANSKVNDDAGTAAQWRPALAVSSCGSFVIAWQDLRSGDYDVYAQMYGATGVPLGPNLKVNDDAGTAYQWHPAVAMDGVGNFVIAWEDEREEFYADVYAQRYDSSGAALGSNFKVNDDDWEAFQRTPHLAMDEAGNFVVTWSDCRYTSFDDIYAQRYDSAGNAIGANFKVDDGPGGTRQISPVIAMSPSGAFAVAWGDDRNGNWDIYAQRYDSTGLPTGANFMVNDDAGTAVQREPDISASSSRKFVITWADYRNGLANPDIYAQMYDSFESAQEANYLVTSPRYAFFAQTNPAVAIDGSAICFSWVDNRRAKGWDIYANIRHCRTPQPFSLVFPPIKAFTPKGVRFDWEDACDPEWCDEVGYDLHVSTSCYFSPESTSVYQDLSASGYWLVLDYGPHFWKVKAKNYCGAELWCSEVRHFVVTGVPYSRGDFNSDGWIDLGDVVFAVNYLYKEGCATDPLETGDVDCDDAVDISDAVYLVNYLFKNGPPPCR